MSENRANMIELTEWEIRNVVPWFIFSFGTKQAGKAQAVTAKRMCEKWNTEHTSRDKYTLTDAKVRQVIHYIRERQMLKEFVCAGSCGYWKETDTARVEDYLKTLRGRISEMQEIVDAGERWKGKRQSLITNLQCSMESKEQDVTKEGLRNEEKSLDLFGAEIHGAERQEYTRGSFEKRESAAERSAAD